MRNEYITIDEFSRMCNVKVETIKKRFEEIPGATKINGEPMFLKGTRYPYQKVHVTEVSSMYKTILKAINERKYIDENYFKICREEFVTILNELESRKYIRKIDVPNKFGTNNYIITKPGSEAVEQNKIKIFKFFSKLLPKIIPKK